MHRGLVKGRVADHHSDGRLGRPDQGRPEDVVHLLAAVVHRGIDVRHLPANRRDVLAIRRFLRVAVEDQGLQCGLLGLIVNLRPRLLGIRAVLDSEYSIISYFSYFVNFGLARYL